MVKMHKPCDLVIPLPEIYFWEPLVQVSKETYTSEVALLETEKY